MNIKNSFLPIPVLLFKSFWVYLKALPLIAAVYVLPIFTLFKISAPHMERFSNITSALTIRQEAATLVADLLSEPVVLTSAFAFIFIVFYSINFIYLITEAMVDKDKKSFLLIFIKSLTAIPRLFTDIASFFAIILIFTALPLLPSLFFELHPLVKMLLGVIWFFGAAFCLFFTLTSLFFTRAAVLRGKWPGDVFTYSAKVAQKRFLKFIIYLLIVGALGWGGIVFLKGIMLLPFDILASIFGLDTDFTTLPFNIFFYSFIASFMITANTVYFLNADYNTHYDRTRMELLSRVSGVNDTSMPSLK